MNLPQEKSIWFQKGDNITIKGNSSCNKPGIEYHWTTSGKGNIIPTSHDRCLENIDFFQTETEFRLINAATDTTVTLNASHPLMWKPFQFQLKGKHYYVDILMNTYSYWDCIY